MCNYKHTNTFKLTIITRNFFSVLVETGPSNKLYEYIFADTLEIRFKGSVYYTLVIVHYASRFCILKRLPGKRAKYIAIPF